MTYYNYFNYVVNHDRKTKLFITNPAYTFCLEMLPGCIPEVIFNL